MVRHGPLFERVEALRREIIKKNELCFHRSPPQKRTSLFGLRKNKQGRNAEEIPISDTLISAEEERIFRLTELKTRQYELAPSQPGDEEKLNADKTSPKNAAIKKAQALT